MELNREQIVKALECCPKATRLADCETMKCPALTGNGCVYFDDGEGDIFNNLLSDALALIKKLIEEKEKIGIENFNLICELSRIKEDTVRKMQERLKKLVATVDGITAPREQLFFVIDQIAKEMLEET